MHQVYLSMSVYIYKSIMVFIKKQHSVSSLSFHFTTLEVTVCMSQCGHRSDHHDQIFYFIFKTLSHMSQPQLSMNLLILSIFSVFSISSLCSSLFFFSRRSSCSSSSLDFWAFFS